VHERVRDWPGVQQQRVRELLRLQSHELQWRLREHAERSGELRRMRAHVQRRQAVRERSMRLSRRNDALQRRLREYGLRSEQLWNLRAHVLHRKRVQGFELHKPDPGRG
jgi:hypothetical protein